MYPELFHLAPNNTRTPVSQPRNDSIIHHLSLDSSGSLRRLDLPRIPLRSLLTDIIPIFDRNTLCHMVDLVDTDQARGKLKHVVAQ